MTTYQTHPRLRHCAVGAHHIFLDLSTERYFMFEGEAAGRFSSFLQGKASSEDLRWLAERAVIEPGSEGYGPAIESVPPSSSAIGCAPERISPLLVGEAFIALISARRRLARLPLVQLLTPGAPGVADAIRSRAIAIAFHRTSRYVPANDQCLVRSLALKDMLGRRGIAAELVIGVRLPFSAHCWVQTGPVVMSDTLDRVVGFKPLLVAR